MLQLCVCRDIKQWKSLESTPEARFPGGELATFELSKLASYLDLTQAHQWLRSRS